MSETDQSESTSRRNPLLWVAALVVGLILFVVLSGDRGDGKLVTRGDAENSAVGSIDRSLLVPPGMRARQYLEQLRADGKPYPLTEVYDRAQQYLQDGSLADAHILYFFAAREEHLPAMMTLAEMSDPTRFRADNSLLDNADVIQAYKWYRKAAAMGDAAASRRIDELKQWASAAAQAENPHARQLLLNFREENL